MRAGRLIGVTAAALLVTSGIGLAPTSTASAATPASITTTSVAASTTGATKMGATKTGAATQKTAARYRVVRSAQMRRATAATRRAATLDAVTTAVRTSEFTEGVPASSYRVTGLRTSGSWATVTLTPAKNAELDPATVVLRRTSGTWSVVDLGTAGVGCDVAPAAAIAALKLDCS